MADDLNNAIIATCKGPYVANITVPPVPNPTAAVPVPLAKSIIYDPVWKTHLTIPDTEHQVQQLQHGKVNRTDETEGPKGDFWPKWLYEGDEKQKQPF